MASFGSAVKTTVGRGRDLAGRGVDHDARDPGGPLPRLGGDVVGVDAVASLSQVPRHRESHPAKPHEPDLSLAHVSSPNDVIGA